MSSLAANRGRIAALLALAATLVLVLGLAGPTASGRGSKTVNIKSLKFKPKTITITAGTRVKWTNNDVVKHNAVDQGVFKTGTIKVGKAKSVAFNTPGTFKYTCTFHPFMKGTIVVK